VESLAEKEKLVLVELFKLVGDEVMVKAGDEVSIIQAFVAAVLVLPAVSVAVT
jgi:hypothetical protein